MVRIVHGFGPDIKQFSFAYFLGFSELAKNKLSRYHVHIRQVSVQLRRSKLSTVLFIEVSEYKKNYYNQIS